MSQREEIVEIQRHARDVELAVGALRQDMGKLEQEISLVKSRRIDKIDERLETVVTALNTLLDYSWRIGDQGE